MPFGQAFWLSRIIGGAVEFFTGSAKAGKSVRIMTRWGLAILTIDPKGFIIDATIDAAADEAVDSAVDTLHDHAYDALHDHLSSSAHSSFYEAIQHAPGVDPHFGGNLFEQMSAFFRAAADQPEQAVQKLLQVKDQLPGEVVAKLQAASAGRIDPAAALQAVQQATQSTPAKYARLIASIKFGGSY